MKRMLLSAFLSGLLLSCTACTQNAAESTESVSEILSESSAKSTQSDETALKDTATAEAETENGKILVAYFSWSGNTTEMASYIAEQTDGDLLEIEPTVPYSDVYEEVGEVAKTERDENARPEIANLPESLDEYDTIFIGYPIWWYTAPMIIGTFLESYDLTGIDVYPFTQSASMDTEQFGNSMEFVRSAAANATVHDGLFVPASDTDGILAYLEENHLV